MTENLKQYQLSGVNNNLQFGLRGARVDASTGAFKFRNAADTDYVNVLADGGQFYGDVVVDGNFTVNGTVTQLNTEILTIEDKNIEIAVSSVRGYENDTTADLSGITAVAYSQIDETPTNTVGTLEFDLTDENAVLASYFSVTVDSVAIPPVDLSSATSGTSVATLLNNDTAFAAAGLTAAWAADVLSVTKATAVFTLPSLNKPNFKNIVWNTINKCWELNQGLNLLSGLTYKINNVDVLSSTALGTGVVSSSLTSVGTLTSGALGTGFTAVNVAQGGTGNSSLTAFGVMVGNGTNAVAVTAAGDDGQVLISTASANPAFGYLDNLRDITTGDIQLSVSSTSVAVNQDLNVVTGNITSEFEGDITIKAAGTNAITLASESGNYEDNITDDNHAISKKYLENYLADESGNIVRTVAVSTSGSIFDIGDVIPTPTGKDVYISTIRLSITTLFDGGSVDKMRVLDGEAGTVLVDVNQVDPLVTGSYMINLPATQNVNGKTLRVEFLQADGSTPATITSGVMSVVVECLKY